MFEKSVNIFQSMPDQCTANLNIQGNVVVKSPDVPRHNPNLPISFGHKKLFLAILRLLLRFITDDVDMQLTAVGKAMTTTTG